MFNELTLLWSEDPGISVAVWSALIVLILYLARDTAHHLLSACGRSIHRICRLSGRALAELEGDFAARNAEILFAQGKESSSKAVEREFTRINDIVASDLSHYPSLHRELSDAIEHLERDYHAATDAPPTPPEWIQVVETIANLPQNGDPMVASILENIQTEISKAQETTTKLYQKTSSERHKLLSGMQPQWRNLANKLEETRDLVAITQSHSEAIDRHMADYEAIRAEENSALNKLTASSLTQFFVSALILGIAIMGGLINFQLIALPMSEMVGAHTQIAGLRTSDIAALVIILVEISMGLFLLDALRITQLFPVINQMPDRMRKRMIWITLGILVVLASIEASLAYMRDLLALDREVLQQSLLGATATKAEFRWIPSIGQMVMGFVLPFALAFVAIPLESFIHATRTVIGLLITTALRILSIAIRIVGGLGLQLSKISIYLYDVVIALPLACETAIRKAKLRNQAADLSDEYIEPKLDDDDEFSGDSTEEPKKSRTKKSSTLKPAVS